MGGQGSGSTYHWWRPTKKRVVEDCLTLEADRWTREKILAPGVHHSGRWVWRDICTGQETSSLNYEVCTLDMDLPWLRLSYSTKGQSLGYLVGLTTTRLHFGGLRWWFVCPLLVNGQNGGRRVGKLYLPPGQLYYGCRHCHQLTYTSCQESRKHDALWRHIAANTGEDYKTVRHFFNGLGRRNKRPW
jgi:hypothetical protein